MRSYLRRQAQASSAPLSASQVANAYNFPKGVTGRGCTIGIIELGGGYTPAAFAHLNITDVAVAGGRNAPDGPNGADGEVQLDIEVASAVAPDAAYRIYFAPNVGTGIAQGISAAVRDKCTAISISWGQAETGWAASDIAATEAALKAARAAGIRVYVAAGDSGADDSTGRPVTDYPASSPNVIGCGGTRLELNTDGTRASEVTWDDNDTQSATGGGVSKVFPGRQVPDIAGNADPDTGYQVVIDGEQAVIGGTSAVAPLYAGLDALLSQALGTAAHDIDLMNVLLTNPGVCFDVTSGDNGAYRAGPGRDDVTGLGVIDGTKLAAVLADTVTDPAPVPTPTPTPTPAPPKPGPGLVDRSFTVDDFDLIDDWAASPHIWRKATKAAAAWKRGA